MIHMEDRLSYLRALAINTLITDAVKVFLDNEDTILKGDFNTSLLDKSKYQAQIADIIKISVEKIYQSHEVIEKEIAGYKIISDILEVFTNALMNKKAGKASNYDLLLLQILPKHYGETAISDYAILLNTCCFVASLSDSAAVHIHNKIMGKQL